MTGFFVSVRSLISAAVASTFAAFAAPSGASKMGYLPQGVGAVATTVEGALNLSVPVTRWMTSAQIADAYLGVNSLDCSAALQSAITHCIANNLDLEIPYLIKINSSVNVDRLVDGAAFDSYFRIFSKSGGGVYVDTAINIFSSSTAYTTDPVSQLIKWQGLRFVAANNALAAYVLNGARFLRCVFEDCSFSKIKCLVSTTYVQSIYFYNCNVRRWAGTFFKSVAQGYDIQVIGGLYEAGAGDCFDIVSPIGCKFWTQIEGVSGTAIKGNGAQGLDISCYFEANGIDFDCRTGGLANQGINLHGSYLANSTATYTVKWGLCRGCTSHGNWHTGNMHDLQADSFVDVNDYAQVNLSNDSTRVFHAGYREGALAPLAIRGANSASYTVSAFTGYYTVQGNRAQLEFVCTLTSTATNPQDTLYIPSGFIGNAAFSGAIAGTVEVSGSAVNNGISTIYISSAVPARGQTPIDVIPANTAGASWTVRGQISYRLAA